MAARLGSLVAIAGLIVTFVGLFTVQPALIAGGVITVFIGFIGSV